MTGRLTPIDRIDNGDGTVTWGHRPDPRARAVHLNVPTLDWPGGVMTEPPKVLGPPPRCLPLKFKDPAQ